MAQQFIHHDLNINEKFVTFLHYFHENVITMLLSIDSNFTNILQDDYENNIGHSHTFSEILAQTINQFQISIESLH